MIIFIALLVVMVTLVVIYVRNMSRPFEVLKRLGIPGPTPLPLFGNLFPLMKQGFLQFHKNMYKEYANEKMYVTCGPGSATIVINDLDLIRDICIKNFNSFANRKVLLGEEPFDKMMTNIKGDHWRNVRNAVSPTFSTGKVKRMFIHVEETCGILLSNLKEKYTGNQPVDLKDIMSCYTMDVIAGTGFGVKLDSLNDRKNPFITEAKKIMTCFTGGLILITYLFPKLIHFLAKIGIHLTATSSGRFFNKFVDEAMANRLEEQGHKRHDFLQLVVDAERSNQESASSQTKALSRADIQGQALIFILAGFDTVATAMSFMLFMLAHHPECCQKIQDELDKTLASNKPVYENIQELHYLEMCLNETLRMYPPGVIIDRECSEDCTIGGVDIPKGTHVLFPVLEIHNDPNLWPEPEKFKPERFLPENKEGRHPFAFLPFGHGPRNCIGMRLALLEIKLAIATILQEMTPVPCEKSVYPMIMQKFQFMPVDGLWATFEPRKK